MKTKFTLVFSAVLLLGGQLMAQTYGIFAEKPEYTTEGTVLTSTDTPNGGWTTNSDITAVLSTDDVYFGQEALKVTMAGKGGGRLYLTSNKTDPEGSEAEGRYVNREEWNDDYALFVCYIKLLTKCDIRICYRSIRDGANVDESDESMHKHGLDTTKIGVWQKFILPMKHGPGEFDGHQSTFEKWVSFTIRDRANVGEFLIDEVYVDYRPKTTFGLFTELDENMLSGSLKTDARTPNGGIVDDGTISEVVTTDAKGGTEALKISMFGVGSGRTNLAYDVSDWIGEKGGANFSAWNDENVLVVFHTKLLTPMDYRIAYSAFREDNQKIDETDISAIAQGMDKTNITDWQKIVVPFNPGWENRIQNPIKWSAFTFRDRDNTGDFLVDEMYVIYPEGGTGISNKSAGQDFLIRNYPNPVSSLTTIEFNLSKTAQTSLIVYNQVGQKVASLIDSKLNSGSHKVTFDVKDLSSGLYIYELRSGGLSQFKKMIVNK